MNTKEIFDLITRKAKIRTVSFGGWCWFEADYRSRREQLIERIRLFLRKIFRLV